MNTPQQYFYGKAACGKEIVQYELEVNRGYKDKKMPWV